MVIIDNEWLNDKRWPWCWWKWLEQTCTWPGSYQLARSVVGHSVIPLDVRDLGITKLFRIWNWNRWCNCKCYCNMVSHLPCISYPPHSQSWGKNKLNEKLQKHNFNLAVSPGSRVRFLITLVILGRPHVFTANTFFNIIHISINIKSFSEQNVIFPLQLNWQSNKFVFYLSALTLLELSLATIWS